MNHPYPEFDKQGKVICQFCGQALHIIAVSHLKKHGVTMQQYQERFKDLKVTGDKYRVVQKFCHASLFAPVAKPLTEIMDEVLVEEPTEPTEEETKSLQFTKEALEALKLSEQENNKPAALLKPKIKNPMQDMKNKILETLKRYFFHIEQNYTIQIFAVSGHLAYEFITDFADPVQKIAINFPKTFWHNKNHDPASNNRLIENGWKIIEIHSLAPSVNELTKTLQPYSR